MSDHTLPLPFPEVVAELPPHALLLPREAARALRVATSTIYRWVDADELDAIKWRRPGRPASRPTIRIPRAAVLKKLSQLSHS